MSLFGADSLLRLRIFLELETKHRLRIPPSKIGICHTIEEQAASVVMADEDELSDFLLPLTSPEADVHLACVPGLGGHAWIFDVMLKAFGSDFGGYGIHWCHNSLPRGRKRWRALATRISQVSKDKKLFLLGFSAGSSVAWSIAEACKEIGSPVSGVIAMDGAPARGWRDLLLKMRRWRRIAWENTDSTPASQYLYQLRRTGEGILRRIKNTPLDCPCLEIQSNRNSLGTRQWDVLSPDCSVHRVPAGHLDLVRHPINQEMCLGIQSWMHARIEASMG